MIRLRTFGTPHVETDDGTPIEVLNRQTKRLGLLIYLASGGQRLYRRDELLALFWPESDEDCARNCLRQSLHILRTELGPEFVLGSGDQEIGVSAEHLECDTRVFVRALGGGFAEGALELYHSDFLCGFHVPDVPDFERWVEARRQQLKNLAIAAARQLAYTAEGTQDLEGALRWWKRAAELSPFDEGVVRRIVSLLIATGNRGEAIRTLTQFENRLRSELEVEPSLETRVLLEAAREGIEAGVTAGNGDGSDQGPKDPTGPWRRSFPRLWMGTLGEVGR